MKSKRKYRKHWYFQYFSECCLCGSQNNYRERRFSPKPKDLSKCYEYGPQWACSDHSI